MKTLEIDLTDRTNVYITSTTEGYYVKDSFKDQYSGDASPIQGYYSVVDTACRPTHSCQENLILSIGTEEYTS